MAWSTRILTSIRNLEEISGSWNELLALARVRSLFLTPDWHCCWYVALGSQARPRTIAVTDENGRLRAIFPLAVVSRTGMLDELELSGDTIASGDHLGLIASSEDWAASWSMIADWLDKELESGSRLRLGMVDSYPMSETIEQTCAEKGWEFIVEHAETAPFVSLPEGVEEFMASMSRKSKYNLRRSWSQLSERLGAPVVTNDVHTHADLVSSMTALSELHTRLWNARGRSGTLSAQRKQVFLTEFCARALDRGWLRLRTTKSGNRIIAALLAFQWQDRTYYYQSGWDPSLRDFSLGQHMVLNAITRSIEDGSRVFDFLRGDEDYKKRFASDSTQLRRYIVAKRGIGKLSLHWMRGRRKVRDLVRSRIDRGKE